MAVAVRWGEDGLVCIPIVNSDCNYNVQTKLSKKLNLMAVERAPRNNCGVQDKILRAILPSGGVEFSLSPGERVGVRGKRALQNHRFDIYVYQYTFPGS